MIVISIQKVIDTSFTKERDILSKRGCKCNKKRYLKNLKNIRDDRKKVQKNVNTD